MVSLNLKVVYFQVLPPVTKEAFYGYASRTVGSSAIEAFLYTLEFSASTFSTLLRRSSAESRQLW